ncbi:MAG: type II secretion system protein, partial [Bacilli bacterium]|nr:type II secretion system protein [Bacilli bacterium]
MPKNKKGFTLIELLAVITLLAVLLAITVPNVMNMIESSKKNAFRDDVKALISVIKTKQIKNQSYDVTTINVANMETELDIANANYESITASLVDDEVVILVVGKNDWEDFVVCGTQSNMKVEKISESTCFVDDSKASKPELATNIIPVMHYNGNWVKADKNNLASVYQWYDYDKKNWANAVTITSGKLETYKKAPLGTVVRETDILTYLVWIPRYKYVIPAGTGARSINIVFENSTTPKSNGTAIGTNYRTHPAFTFDQELNGFWVGKFEITGTIDAMTVKPNLTALREQSVSSFYAEISNMQTSGNAYGFNANEVDTHMMKNDEWGAVAYLSMSTYGLNNEIYKNNSSDCYTGRSGGNVGGSQKKISGVNEYMDTGFYTYDGKCATTTTIVTGIDAGCTTINNILSDTSLSYKASTTGNIYGIYDMSGGSWEYVMGNYNNYSGYLATENSGFNGPNGYDGTTVTTGLDFPITQYYNLYTTNDAATACNGGICYGHALSEANNWHGDANYMVYVNGPWSVRGGDYSATAEAGAFYFSNYTGSAAADGSARIVVA